MLCKAENYTVPIFDPNDLLELLPITDYHDDSILKWKEHLMALQFTSH
mgnify:CR=1 FL=1